MKVQIQIQSTDQIQDIGFKNAASIFCFPSFSFEIKLLPCCPAEAQ